MSTTNDFARFTEVDNLTQDWLFNVGDAIGVGDLVYDNGSDVARPADKLTSLTTEALDQAQFAQKFIGCSQEQILAAETNSTKRFTVRVDGVMDFNCPSQTFNKGDLVGIYSNGTNLDPQQVDKVTHPALAIGIVVKYYGSATTRVRARIVSRKTWDIVSNWASPALFDGQTVAATNTLTDANQTLTVASAMFQKMVPTAARSVTLPKEAQSKGLTFIFWNNSGGANTVTFKKSDGSTNVDGTAGVTQGKVGIFMCDGATWYGVLSA
jgi:hypothetical protein